MSMKLYNDENIQAIANAIRTKNGSVSEYKVSEMAQAILDIPSSSGIILTTSLSITSDKSSVGRGGSVTFTCVLSAKYDDESTRDYDLYGRISNAPIYLYNSSWGTVGSGVTNEEGVATITMNNVTSTDTYKAGFIGTTEYPQVFSSTVTITVNDYLFYDTCTSSEGLTNYSEVALDIDTTAKATFIYDSSMNAYSIKGTHQYFVIEEISALNNLDNYIIECDIRVGSTSAYNQIGLGIHEQGTTLPFYMYRMRGDNKVQKFKGNASSSTETNVYTGSTSNAWLHYKITKQGNNFNLELSKDGTTLTTTTWDIGALTNPRIGIIKQTEQSTQVSYIKNIKAEAIQ